MTYDEFERTAREMWNAIQPRMRHGVEYLVVSEEAVPHPTLPGVYTLGECATGELDLGVFDAPSAVRSGVHLYYGSFKALAELREGFEWEEELWETITHEIRHHRESTAGEDALEDFDYAADENFKRREGQPFDPLFYRSGEPVEDGAWDVDGDLFIERTVTPEEFAAQDEIEVTIEGEEVFVQRPPELGDVCYVYLQGLYDDEGEEGDVALVLVRRRGALEQLRGLFRREPPRVLEFTVDFGDESELD